MERKVFISILGTGYYEPTKYFFDKISGKERNSRFVQETAISEFCGNWDNNDKIFIFLTDSARTENWENPAKRSNKKGSYSGLSKILKEMDIQAEVIDKDIPDGKNEKEIWDIFQIIFNQLKVNDKVYFDITHAFRSLPMLLMVLINYSKFLKNIEVKSITYGNHQAEKDGYSPVINLTAFSQLQDWTSASDEFINFGSVDKLVDLSFAEINPILKESKGKNASATTLKKLNKELPSFVKNIQTSRGMNIILNKEGSEINKIFTEFKQDNIKPLSPILEKISKVLLPFNEAENIKNGFFAVSWCINNGLIQQGITLLKESITTFICDELNIDYKEEKNRNIVDSAFKIVNEKIDEEDWKGDARENKNITKIVIKESKYLLLLNKEFNTISSIRNDINHAGFKENSIKKPDKFEKMLNELLCEILKKLK
ncbi:MAG: TIGR02221 family CRISPR-associated protein [Bacteroidota bacterium]|nr:TIGR02221 family CRISPR-associated protein [Bacteroidota bacterium]